MLGWILESMTQWVAILPLMLAFVVVWTVSVLVHDVYAEVRERRAEKQVRRMNEFIGAIDASAGDGDDPQYGD